MSIAYNDDILTEILLRLPAKSLIRFKLVCKKLHKLISSQQFCHLHALHHRHSKSEPSLLLFLKHGEKSRYFYLQPRVYGQKLVPYIFPPALVNPTILSFSNGLFLLRVENAPEGCCIYNPTTMQYKWILPNERFRTVIGLSLVYDPLKSSDYKIICVRGGRRRSAMGLSPWQRCQIEIYESETSAWRRGGEPFLAPNDVDFNRGIYWNDGIHWSGIYFDLLKGVVYEHPRITIPGNPMVDTFNGDYIESKGHLHYIAYVEEQNSVAVLELQNDYSLWSLKYHIDLARDFGPLSVLSICRGDTEEESMIMFHQPGKAIAYRFHDKSIKVIVDFKEDGFYEDGCIQFVPSSRFQFVESLVPLG